MAFVRAAREGDFAKIVELFELNPNNIDQADFVGETALQESIHHGNTEIAQYLLQNNAIPTLCRGDGSSPLHIAANHGRYYIASLLLKNEKVRKNINRKNSIGNTALHEACRKTQVDCVHLLVENGANRNITNKRGQKPIDFTRDVRLYRILRGQKWYDDLKDQNIVKRLENGEYWKNESPNNHKKKKKTRRGGRNKKKNQNNIINNNTNNTNNQETLTHSSNNQKNKKHKNGGIITNKELDNNLKTWLEFNDMISIEKQQQYQCVYLERKLKMKWINYVKSLVQQNLDIQDYNHKMRRFADGLYLEYSQPQYEGNHYVPKTPQIYNDNNNNNNDNYRQFE